jgi:hypothetical protein
MPSPSRSAAQCPYCRGQVTYAFRGRTALLYSCGSFVAGCVLVPLFGPVLVPLLLLVPLVASAYLDRWY